MYEVTLAASDHISGQTYGALFMQVDNVKTALEVNYIQDGEC